MKRKISLLLALITLLMSMNLIFTSCSRAEEETTETEAETSEESVQEEAKLEKIYLVKPVKASAQVTKLAEGASELIAKQTGIATEIVSDADLSYQAKENHYYVIFGNTTYEQSKALSVTAETQKIYYAAKEDSVAIYATTDQLMSIGAEKLFADCVKDGNFAVGDEYASLCVDASSYVKENWTLNCPAFTRGMLDNQKYNLGYGMERNKDYSYMHIARNATAQHYNDYLAQLESFGYKKEFENEIDGNLYASFIGPLGSNIYVYFTKIKYEVRIIEDNVSAPLSEFNYKLDASKDTRLYMFRLDYKSEDCFLIHLADNSWIIIDGGMTGSTAGSAYVRDLYKFMADRSSLAAGEKIQIAAWYLTHAHEDHFFGVYGLVFEYGDKIQIHRVIDNTAKEGYFVLNYRKQYVELLERIKKLNPDVMYLKIHSGMVVELADTTIETLFTHEDIVVGYTQNGVTNPNRGSIVSVFNIAGLTFLETADNMVYDTYKDFNLETLTTDLLKIAHHYYDKTLDSLYKSLYQTGKVSYCYISRQDTHANDENNYQAPTMALFGERYLQGSSNYGYEFYRDGTVVKMNKVSC